MSALDGLMFGLGRDVLLPLALIALVFVAAVVVDLAKALRRQWWRRRGVPCGETHHRYPTCTLTRDHSGAHAGPLVEGRRLRWKRLPHGEMSFLEAVTTLRAQEGE